MRAFDTVAGHLSVISMGLGVGLAAFVTGDWRLLILGVFLVWWGAR